MTLPWHNFDLLKWKCGFWSNLLIPSYVLSRSFILLELLFHLFSCVNQEPRMLFSKSKHAECDWYCVPTIIALMRKWIGITDWMLKSRENVWFNCPNKLRYSVCSTITASISLPWHPFRHNLMSPTCQVSPEECGQHGCLRAFVCLCSSV